MAGLISCSEMNSQNSRLNKNKCRTVKEHRADIA